MGRVNAAKLPISERVLLSTVDASAYTGLGLQKLYDLSKAPEGAGLTITIGHKVMWRREKLHDFLMTHNFPDSGK